MTSYRLPFGGFTADSKEYGQAWKALGEKAEKFFPAYSCMAYDPMIRMVLRNPKPSDYWKNTSFDLTPEAVQNLQIPPHCRGCQSLDTSCQCWNDE